MILPQKNYKEIIKKLPQKASFDSLIIDPVINGFIPLKKLYIFVIKL